MNLKYRKLRNLSLRIFPALFIILVLLFNFSTITYAQKPKEVHVFGFSDSPPSSPFLPSINVSDTLLEYFENKSDLEVIFHDLNNSYALESFLKITNMLTILGIEIIPPEVCTPCKLKLLTQDELLTTYGSPLVGIFHNDRLTAIIIGITPYETLDEALMMHDEDVKVFTQHDIYSLSNVQINLEEFFLMEGSGINLVLSITLLALADSVNPCTFLLFTALLFVTLHSLGKMRAAATGLAFILAIFIGYYILGLGVFHILVAIPNLDTALAVLGLTFGVFNIMRGLKIFNFSIPKPFHNFMEMKTKSYATITASFGLGLMASFTLLPCSGGPYMVGLGLLSTLKDSIQSHLLLTLYNLIFLIPLILIFSAILLSNRISHKIKVFRSTDLGIMDLIGGSLLSIICIYLIVS